MNQQVPDPTAPDRAPDGDADAAPLASLGDGDLAAAGPEALLFELHRTQRALVQALDQGHREASANRAQARELIRSLERMQQTQEYLGTALREERRRARWLSAVLLLAPLAAAALVWAAWVRYESGQERLHADLVAALDRPVPTIERPERPAPAAAVVPVDDGTVEALRSDVERLLGELGTSRDERAAELERSREREQGLSKRLNATERELGEVAGLRSELERVRERAAAEAARSDELQRELDSAKKAGAAPSLTQPVEGEPAQQPASAKKGPPRGVATDAVPGAVRAETELEALRSKLNGLLGDAHGVVRYEFDVVGGASGRKLVDVRVTGRDESGRAVRSIEAPLAELSVDRRKRRALLRFSDGHLIVGKTRAPFFEGSYGLLLDVEPEAWRRSGLTVVRFH